MTREGFLTKRDELRFAKARLADDLCPEDLRQEAWQDVLRTIRECKSPRTRLMADRVVLDRTDPIPREPATVIAPVVLTWQGTPPPSITSSSPTSLVRSNGDSTSKSLANGRVSWSPTGDSAKQSSP